MKEKQIFLRRSRQLLIISRSIIMIISLQLGFSRNIVKEKSNSLKTYHTSNFKNCIKMPTGRRLTS